MEFAKITAKGQTTIPKAIRDAAHLRTGDVIAFEVEGDHLVVRKINGAADGYLRGIESAMQEWNSAEDDEAWRDL